ncbi:hypothetical protein [Mycoavidus sp. SF9855]|uniref:hypothetical protein n=1 Tax=Mycoavidus sp. SF9855 TaxID=2968475 RepID=UPI00211D0967|nr:hypothetical protein [Mycoavidus sp. SF9855]UUM21133.1 hypothetical protein NQD60_06675 [Mycoavidus sp. SF9855]
MLGAYFAFGSPHKGSELLEYAETDIARFLVKHAAPIANFVGTLLSWFNSANATITQPFF